MNKSQYKIMFELENKHFWFLAKREFFKSLLPKTSKKLNILDLGCGTGGFSQQLEKWGKVTRIEQSPKAIKYLKQRGLKYIKCDIEKYNFGKNKYDLICFIDVLYHQNITDIGNMLDMSRKALVTGGQIIVMDCALPFLYSHHDKMMMAKKRFYLSEIQKYLKDKDFFIKKKSYIFFLIFPFFLFIRLINKIIPTDKVTNPPKIINFIMLSLCKVEAYLLQYISFPIGSSIVIVGKKC